MKGEVAVKIFIDACKKAQKNKRHPCPLYRADENAVCYAACNASVPKFLVWLMGNELYAEDAKASQLFTKHKTIPRGKR